MKIITTILFCAFVAQSAYAGALADKAQWEKIDGKIKKSVDSTAKPNYCGQAIPTAVDKATFQGADAMKVADWCSTISDGLASFCSKHAKDKAAIVKAVQNIKCAYDPSLKAVDSQNHWGTKFELSGTTLNARFSKNSSNLSGETVKFLEEKL